MLCATRYMIYDSILYDMSHQVITQVPSHRMNIQKYNLQLPSIFTVTEIYVRYVRYLLVATNYGLNLHSIWKLSKSPNKADHECCGQPAPFLVLKCFSPLAIRAPHNAQKRHWHAQHRASLCRPSFMLCCPHAGQRTYVTARPSCLAIAARASLTSRRSYTPSPCSISRSHRSISS